MPTYLPAQVNGAALSPSPSCMALGPLAFEVLTANPPLASERLGRRECMDAAWSLQNNSFL